MTQASMPNYPTQRLKPVDGMVINARIWEEAHEYHRRREQWHMRLTSYGILSGLQVIESDPPDAAVWIQPGFAIDAWGRSIVLRQMKRCEIGATRGLIYVCLTAGEHEAPSPGQTQAPEGDDQATVTFWHEDVNIVPSATPQQDVPLVEVARIWRGDPVAIQDAAHPRRPGENEIDQRYRRELLPGALPLINAGILHLGAHDPCAWESLDALANSAEFARLCRLGVVEDAGAIDSFEAFDLLYARLHPPFKADPGQISALSVFLGHGVLLAEVSSDADTNAGQAALDELFNALGMTPAQLKSDHALLTSPHRFAQPPEGSAPPGGQLRVAGDARIRAIASGLDLGSMWRGSGATRAPAASREAIRAAHEWGMNLLHWVMQPARQASGEDLR